MITKHSINLAFVNEPCFALSRDMGCKILVSQSEACCTSGCPFYKPIGCKDWVRIEDRQGTNLIPPEEAFGKRRSR